MPTSPRDEMAPCVDQPLNLKPPAERMADAMRDMRAAGHVVTAASLAVYGDFTDAEVARYGPEAANLARTRETRQVA